MESRIYGLIRLLSYSKYMVLKKIGRGEEQTTKVVSGGKGLGLRIVLFVQGKGNNNLMKSQLFPITTF